VCGLRYRFDEDSSASRFMILRCVIRHHDYGVGELRIDEWRDDYHLIRPHTGLGQLTPEEFRVRETEFFQKQVVC